MTKPFAFTSKRASYWDVTDYLNDSAYSLNANDLENLESIDEIYRALVALLFNYVPNSGHPGGSISSGRIVEHLIYKQMAYSLACPHDKKADIISYAAGHKALGLYAMWALRNEGVRIADKSLLATKEIDQLRLEDLLGFRHNKVHNAPLFKQFNAKPLGGHPETSTPFVRTVTGASGVGDGSAVGLAIAAADSYGDNCPTVHVIEGEGGLTAGRVSEALATAATAQLKNIVFHIDWNEASIETERVTAENGQPGDYVQWTPLELFAIHDFNVIYVQNGHDFNQIHIAQQLLSQIDNHQPTAIVYRTKKGWKYGIEGKASHGSGHKFASEGFYKALESFEQKFKVKFPRFEGEKNTETIEKFYWDSLLVIRKVLENNPDLASYIAKCVKGCGQALEKTGRKENRFLDCQKAYTLDANNAPEGLQFKVGESYTTRGALGSTLSYINQITKGALMVASADLYNSTGSVATAKEFPTGDFNAVTNPLSRRVAVGGICEDAMAAICSGISSFGNQIGVASSYGAFVGFEHVAARLHAIGVQTAREVGQDANTLVLFNGHASLPTGEDGPTHADPQSLQLLQQNFPKGACITLTPMEVDEIWPLMAHAFSLKPAILAPFVIRSSHKYLDRAQLGMDSATCAIKGAYYLHRAEKGTKATLVVQGAGVGRIVAEKLLPKIKAENLAVNVIYITSAELFDSLTEEEQERIFPTQLRKYAMGVTDFTMPTLEHWLLSSKGRKHSLYPHKEGLFLGSASASKLFEEAGLDADSIWMALEKYIQDLTRGTDWL